MGLSYITIILKAVSDKVSTVDPTTMPLTASPHWTAWVLPLALILITAFYAFQTWRLVRAAKAGRGLVSSALGPGQHLTTDRPSLNQFAWDRSVPVRESNNCMGDGRALCCNVQG